MSSKIKHKVDMAGRPYIEVGSPRLAGKVFREAYDKFADALVKELFEQKAKDKDDEQIL